MRAERLGVDLEHVIVKSYRSSSIPDPLSPMLLLVPTGRPSVDRVLDRDCG